MTTGKLLWGMTWRGGVWGLLIGTTLGIIYGAIFAEILMFAGYGKQGLFIQGPNQIGGGVSAMLFISLLGAIMGAMFGVPTGFIVGIANGFLLGGLTSALFFPLGNARVFRWTLFIVSAGFTIIAACACFIVIAALYFRTEVATHPLVILIILIPALIAGIAAGFLSRLLTRWYERESIKGAAQNVSSN